MFSTFDNIDSASGKYRTMGKFIKLLNPGQILPVMVFIVFGMCWSIVSLTMNHQLMQTIDSFAVFWILSTIAFVISCVSTYLFSSLVSYVFPVGENDFFNRNQLIGKAAYIISGKVDAKFGRARIRNPHSNITLFCKVDQGEPTIKNGEEVVIWKYDQKTGFFLVQKIDRIEEYEFI